MKAKVGFLALLVWLLACFASMKFRLTTGKHTRFEGGQAKRYMPGDVFEPTEQELKDFGTRLEPVEEEQESSTIDSGKNPGENGPKEESQTPTEAPTLESIDGIGAKTAEALRNAGVLTLADLARVASGPELAQLPGIGKATAARIRKALLALEPEQSPDPAKEEKVQEGDGIVKEGIETPLGESGTLTAFPTAEEPRQES